MVVVEEREVVIKLVVVELVMVVAVEVGVVMVVM